MEFARLAVAEVHVSPWEAHIGRALLESEGIPAFLDNEHHIGANWPISYSLGGVRVLVPREHFDAARTILAARERGDLEAALAKEFPRKPLICSNCGATAFAQRRSSRGILAAFLLLMVAAVTFPPRKLRACVACGQVVAP